MVASTTRGAGTRGGEVGVAAPPDATAPGEAGLDLMPPDEAALGVPGIKMGALGVPGNEVLGEGVKVGEETLPKVPGDSENSLAAADSPQALSVDGDATTPSPPSARDCWEGKSTIAEGDTG